MGTCLIICVCVVMLICHMVYIMRLTNMDLIFFFHSKRVNEICVWNVLSRKFNSNFLHFEDRHGTFLMF